MLHLHRPAGILFSLHPNAITTERFEFTTEKDAEENLHFHSSAPLFVSFFHFHFPGYLVIVD